MPAVAAILAVPAAMNIAKTCAYLETAIRTFSKAVRRKRDVLNGASQCWRARVPRVRLEKKARQLVAGVSHHRAAVIPWKFRPRDLAIDHRQAATDHRSAGSEIGSGSNRAPSLAVAISASRWI